VRARLRDGIPSDTCRLKKLQSSNRLIVKTTKHHHRPQMVQDNIYFMVPDWNCIMTLVWYGYNYLAQCIPNYDRYACIMHTFYVYTHQWEYVGAAISTPPPEKGNNRLMHRVLVHRSCIVCQICRPPFTTSMFRSHRFELTVRRHFCQYRLVSLVSITLIIYKNCVFASLVGLYVLDTGTPIRQGGFFF
jgi:hypothetical protein